MSREICRRQKKTTHIPFDVMFNILTRLSLRVLSRFKCVCKDWNSSIQARIIPKTHPHNFIIVRRQYRYNTHAEFYSIDNDGSAANYFYQFTKNHPVQTMVSCNGLLCFTSNDGKLRLCNPTRKETAILPKPRCLRKEHHCKTVTMGFGFDSTMERYKIVVWDTVEILEPEIITLGTKSSWRTINNQKLKSSSYFQSIYPTCSPIYIEGASYWYNFTNQILSFSFSREEYRVISTPKPEDFPNFTELHEIRGRPCIVKRARHESLLKMWILKDYDKELWVKEVIDFQSNIPIQLVMAVQGSEILMQTEKKNTNELVLYRFNDQNEVIPGIKVQGLPFTPDYECKYQFHRESLVSSKSLALESYQEQ